jgi:DNA-binding XRE family transcriptional regulator
MKNRIDEIRKAMVPKKSISQLAKDSGISRQSLIDIISGEIKNPSGNAIFSISRALGKPVEEVFFIDSVLYAEQKKVI